MHTEQSVPALARDEYLRLQRLNHKVSLLRRSDGYCYDFSHTWRKSGAIDKRELLGLRWLEFIHLGDLPRLFAWLRDDAPGPFIYRSVGAGGAPMIVSLVKKVYDDVAVCGGDCRGWIPGDEKLLAR